MADGLFGVPTGLRAYQDDQVKLSELALRKQTSDAGVRLADAQAANLESDNRRADTEAKRKSDEATNAERLREALGRLGRGEPADGSAPSKPVLAGGSPFDKAIASGMAQVKLLQSLGNVKEAAELLSKLSGGVKDLAQARQASTAAAENEYDAANKRHEGVSKFLSGVTDQASYDAAKMQLAGSGFLSKEDLDEMPPRYNPLFVRSAIAGTAAQKQKADLAREAARAGMQNANDQDQIKARKLAQDLAERTHTLAKEREARLTKQGDARLAAGDKPLPPASQRELDVVRGELKRVGIKAGDAQGDMVADIAEQVKTLVDANPGLSRSEATTRVVSEMKERGELEIARFGSDKYSPKQGSVTMPLPTPKTAAELKKGNYYLDAEDGLVKLFDGKGFKVSTRRRRTDVATEE